MLKGFIDDALSPNGVPVTFCELTGKIQDSIKLERILFGIPVAKHLVDPLRIIHFHLTNKFDFCTENPRDAGGENG